MVKNKKHSEVIKFLETEEAFEICLLGKSFFEKETDFYDWMLEKNIELEEKSPIEVCKTSVDPYKVEKILQSMSNLKSFMVKQQERKKNYEKTSRFQKNKKDVEDYFKDGKNQKLLKRGMNVLDGNGDKFFEWMASEILTLNYKAPIEVLLEDEDGGAKVCKLLGAVEHKIYM